MRIRQNNTPEQKAEAEAEAARWAARLKLVEARARLAQDVLEGRHDALVESVKP